MSGYAKLFSSILHSTVWLEPNHVRLVWITMLAMANRKGVVEASLPGLAVAARVSLEECREALDKFLSPDPHSRTKEHDGRRIGEVDGGWVLLNYEKHREAQSRLAKSERQARWRAKKEAEKMSTKRLSVDADDEDVDEPPSTAGSGSGSALEGVQGEGSDSAMIPCPKDLRLNQDQVGIAEMQGISKEAIDAITAAYISGYLAKPEERRVLGKWLSGLSRAVHERGREKTIEMNNSSATGGNRAQIFEADS